MTDIEYARNANKLDITKIAQKLNIEKNIIPYGFDKAKIKFDEINKEEKGKLILVTSINPTPYGEGKTTVSIGLTDGLNKIGAQAIAALREPSLGPVFGIKGGATGGGLSQVVPMEDINLHFTGDLHAITTANNLISATIDNHIYFGNELNINPNKITFNRCMDMNDRALRNINLSNREDKFNITAASEIMSILCLSKNFKDLKEKLSNILIGFNNDDKPIYTKDLKLEGSLATILKDAIYPNLVQTLENNPVIIHGGPFANISFGCNSIIATKLALKLSDYVVTEAGFGADLGAEKFFDIKCRYGNLKPNCVVIVCTVKALKYNANINKEDILKENPTAVKEGLSNLEVHIDNMLNYTNNIIVCLNKYDTDTEEEINIIKNYVESRNIKFSVNDSYSKGSSGSTELAKKVIDTCNKENDFKLLYDTTLDIKQKIETIAKNIYHTTKINYTKESLDKIEQLNKLKYNNLPICIAKTQYSISDNPKLLGYPKDFEIEVKNINIYTGASFIVVYLGNIMTMPGLSRHANYENIDISENHEITGLF